MENKKNNKDKITLKVSVLNLNFKFFFYFIKMNRKEQLKIYLQNKKINKNNV